MRKNLRNLMVVQFADVEGAEQLLKALREGEQQHGLRLDKYAIISRDVEGHGAVIAERHISVRWAILVGLGVGLAFALVNTIAVDLWPFVQQDALQWIETLLPYSLHFVLVPILIGTAAFVGNEGFARARNYVGFMILGPNPNARQPGLLLGLLLAAVAGIYLALISTLGTLLSMLLFLRVKGWFPSLYTSPPWVFASVGFAVDLASRVLIYGAFGVAFGISLSQRVNMQFTSAELLQEAEKLAAGTTALVAVARFGDLAKAQPALAAIRKGALIENTLPEGIALRLGVPSPEVVGEPQRSGT